MFEKIYRSLVLVLLIVLVLAVGAVGYFAYVENKENAAQAELCYQTITDANLSGLLADYQKAAYDTPSVNNINKQMFMAEEYQIMVIAVQTTILSACLP